MKPNIQVITFLLSIFFSASVVAKEYHVAKTGSDKNAGTKKAPFLTIQAAANVALAGDVVTVHQGIYRERIDPKNGGSNELTRIVYQAAKGEKVVIKGSEVVNDWEKVEGTVWKAVIPNSVLGDYNPYTDLVFGDWFNPLETNHHTGEVFINGKSLFEQNSIEGVNNPKEYQKAVNPKESLYTWYAEVGDENTTFWANFQELNPNNELVEINVREACFYPRQTGIDYVTVRGFEMSQAATQWAAPTAEQIGLIGTHWSKGWIIENNIISNSKSVGITLGKDRATGHNVWQNNKAKDGATHYNEVIFRALDAGWSKENIGSHIVRNNVIFNCGQAGIVGSLGAVFSQIYNNHIYDIYTKRTYNGAEMGGIKIHAPIDMIIRNNRIHNTFIGIWLDWMAEGVRVTSNLLYDNSHHDLFLEVNHGPILVDNNILLSQEGWSLQVCSDAVAYAHNLFTGRTKTFTTYMRSTPCHLAHSTAVKGVRNIQAGDCRMYNNIYIKAVEHKDTMFINRNHDKIHVGYGTHGYNHMGYESFTAGNLFFGGATPYKNEENFIENEDFTPTFKIEETDEGVFLNFTIDNSYEDSKSEIVNTKKLGSTIVTEAIFETPNGKPYFLNKDYSGEKRNESTPTVGPFENLKPGKNRIKVW